MEMRLGGIFLEKGGGKKSIEGGKGRRRCRAIDWCPSVTSDGSVTMCTGAMLPLFDFNLPCHRLWIQSKTHRNGPDHSDRFPPSNSIRRNVIALFKKLFKFFKLLLLCTIIKIIIISNYLND